MEKVQAGDLLAILEYPVKLASGLERLQDGQDMTQQARDEIERLEAAQTEAAPDRREGSAS